jgi:diguanylate cyclase
VVAEGIEDEATWARARADKIDYGQGYYLSRPVPAADVTAWLNAPPGPAGAAA